jgi:hypothetical protein
MMDHQTVIRVDKSVGNYFILHRSACNDRRLSIEALGLHTWMMSRPDNWEFSVAGMVASRKDGEVHIRTALNELKEHGYVRHYRERNEKGQLGKAVILVLETPDVEIPNQVIPNLGNANQGKSLHTPEILPKPENPDLGLPKQDEPKLDSPNLGNQAQISTYSLPSTDLCVVEEEDAHDPFDFDPSQKFDKLHDAIATKLGKAFLDAIDMQCLTQLIKDNLPGQDIIRGLEMAIKTYKPKNTRDKGINTLRFAEGTIRGYYEARLEMERGKQELAAGGGQNNEPDRTGSQGNDPAGGTRKGGGGYYDQYRVGTDL